MLGTREMNNCFRLKSSGGIGTTFLYGDERGCVFFTAAHVVKGVKAGERIFLKRPDDWEPFTVRDVVQDDEGHDIAAFTVDDIAVPNAKFPRGEIGLLPGDELKFLGFPHGLESGYPSEVGFATPLVRTVNFSGSILINDVPIVVFDGFNNPGYSGGPVYWISPSGDPLLLSIIAGYRREIGESSHVYRKDSDGVEHPHPELFVRPNSGMIYGCPGDRPNIILKRMKDRM